MWDMNLSGEHCPSVTVTYLQWVFGLDQKRPKIKDLQSLKYEHGAINVGCCHWDVVFALTLWYEEANFVASPAKNHKL